MTIEQLRAKLAGIIASLQSYASKEAYVEADHVEMKRLEAEFDTISASITAKENIERMTNIANAGNRQAPAGAAPLMPAGHVQVIENKSGFKNFGHFLSAVKQSSTGNLDPIFKNALYEKHGEEGGFLVPEDIGTEIQKKVNGDGALLPKTTSIPVSGNSLSYPIDESAPWNGGIDVYWVAEGAPVRESGKGKLGLASHKLHKMAALVKVSDELLEDSTALEGYMKAKAPVAIQHKLNSSIISGDGVGKPQGYLNSGFKVTVLKESGQAAETIVARNIINMISHLLPGSKAEWHINAGCVPQLLTMKDDIGNFIYLAPGSQMNNSIYGMLMGMPVIPFIGSMNALGDEGDIALVDLSYYTTITKQGGGIQSAMSQHLFFDQNAQAFRFTMRVDGSCPFKTPVTTEKGDFKLSGIITLEAR